MSANILIRSKGEAGNLHRGDMRIHTAFQRALYRTKNNPTCFQVISVLQTISLNVKIPALQFRKNNRSFKNVPAIESVSVILLLKPVMN